MTASRGALALRIALVSLIALPWLPAAFLPLSGLDVVGDLLDRWFAFHCHREPGRTFEALSVCWRCYGIYFGLGGGALFVQPKLRPIGYRVWVMVAALLLLLDVLTEVLAMRPAFSPLRFFSGSLLGWPVGVALVLSLESRSTR
jgi:uncharacterized membrane protein